MAEIEVSARFLGRFDATQAHMLDLGHEPCVALRPGLSGQGHAVRDDVRLPAALDASEIGDGFLIDAQELHAADRIGRHLDGADSFFRLDAGMGRAAMEGYGYAGL